MVGAICRVTRAATSRCTATRNRTRSGTKQNHPPSNSHAGQSPRPPRSHHSCPRSGNTRPGGSRDSHSIHPDRTRVSGRMRQNQRHLPRTLSVSCWVSRRFLGGWHCHRIISYAQQVLYLTESEHFQMKIIIIKDTINMI